MHAETNQLPNWDLAVGHAREIFDIDHILFMFKIIHAHAFPAYLQHDDINPAIT